MSYSAENLAELELLMLYDLSNLQTGLKIHGTAKPDAITAAQRLYEKGFITQKDGGYLTDLGIEAAEHAHALFSLLTTTIEH
jgi:uncharacterized protein (TIGR02647 family)